MSFREVFQGQILDDKGRKRLKITASDYFFTKINKIPSGKLVWITVDDRAPRRSDQQNRLYWMYLNYISEETGNEPEDLHEHFAQTYLLLPESILTIGTQKQSIRKRRSTTDLSKAEFSDYLQKIERDTGIRIPDTEAFLYGKKEEQIEIYNNVMSEYPEEYEEPTI